MIQFEDEHGRQTEFTPSFALLNKFVPVGERFTVIYRPDRPHNVKLIAETNRRSLVPALCGGLVFFAVGFLTLLGVLPTTGSVSGPDDLLLPLFCALSLLGSLFPLVYGGLEDSSLIHSAPRWTRGGRYGDTHDREREQE